jgi:agmatinase
VISLNREDGRLNLPFTGLVSFMRSPVCTDISQLDADIAIIGAPTDEGSPWIPGARFAPRSIREQSMRLRSFSSTQPGYYDIDDQRRYLERESRLNRIVDCGDADIIYTNVTQTFDNITELVRSVVATGAMPVTLGGDHAIAFPVVRGFSEAIDIIHFDAHLDFSPFRHGSWGSNGQPIRLLADLPNIGHIAQIGIRALSTQEANIEDALKRGNDIATVKQTRARGLENVLERIDKNGKVYVTIDVDCLDMPLVPGCSSAEPGGFDYHEFRDMLTCVAERYEVVGFDCVEVNPLLDVRAQHTSVVAAGLIREFLARIVEQPKWKARHNVKD